MSSFSSNPKVTVIKTSADQIVQQTPQRSLIIGQQLGSVYTTGDLISNIENNGIEINNVNKDSQIGLMMKAFKDINTKSALDIIPLDDSGTAVSATGTVTFTGPSTEAGEVDISIGSSRKNTYSVGISDTDTATIIGDALVALITADELSVITAVNVAGVVTMTAKNGGTVGNFIAMKSKGIVAGVSVSLVGMASGLNDPIITNLFDVIGDTERYQHIMFPGNYDETILQDFLGPRFNADNIILDGVGIISKTETLSNLKSFLNTKNDQSLAVNCNKVEDEALYKGGALLELNYVQTAKIGGLRSLRLTDGANLSQYVPVSNRDNIGGVAIASLPYANTLVPEINTIDRGLGFSPDEVNELNDAGGFVLGNNTTRTNIIMDVVKTTYKTDIAGNPDITYQYLNDVDVASNVAEFIFNNSKSDFVMSRLTDGPIQSDSRSINNETKIRARFISYYQTMSTDDFMLTRTGQENLNFFIDNLSVILDLDLGKVIADAKTPFVRQLREITYTLRPVFNI